MPQNSEDVIARRRANVARLYLQGWTQQRIADQEGVDRSQISLDLTEIRQDWLASTVFDFNAAKIQELQKIDNLEATAWQAWYDSMQPLKKSSKKMRGEVPAPPPPLLADVQPPKQKPKSMEQYEYTEERLADPRYLGVIDRCIERRCRILGLDAPLKIAETDKEGNNVSQKRTWIIKDHTGGHHVPAPDEQY